MIEWVKSQNFKYIRGENFLAGLNSLHIVFKQTDLWLKADGELDPWQIKMCLKTVYQEIEQYINMNEDFLLSLRPCEVSEVAPEIIKEMSRNALQANVGPMAGIAGAIADSIGKILLLKHKLIFCNNGGDIFYMASDEQSFFISAPGSPFHNMIKIHVPSALKGKGLCTSSGISGHSINMGRAYAVTILAKNACLADVWATAISNRIKSHLDIENVLDWCLEKESIEGGVILVDNYIGAWGDIRLSRV
jgi:ApbE superfamily uncharacterized protein (UPF0280 family)